MNQLQYMNRREREGREKKTEERERERERERKEKRERERERERERQKKEKQRKREKTNKETQRERGKNKPMPDDLRTPWMHIKVEPSYTRATTTLAWMTAACKVNSTDLSRWYIIALHGQTSKDHIFEGHWNHQHLQST